MTKEQNEAIEYFINKIIDAKPQYIETMINGKIIKEEVCQIKMRFDHEESEKMKTILNMLKEKDKEIEKLRKHNKELLRKLRNRVKEVKKLTKYSLYKKEFSTLNKQIKKQKVMINLMAECILNLDNEKEICTKVEDSCYDYAGQNGKTCDTCIKQYFERKVEDECKR